MNELLQFLNEQSGDRLLGYGVGFLIFTYYIMQGLVYIFQAIFSSKK